MINLVFGVEGVLTCPDVKDEKLIKFFKREGAVITTASKTHYLFPGVVEMMQQLFKLDGVKVGFYCSEDKKNAGDFITQLKKKVYVEGSVCYVYDFDPRRSTKSLASFLNEGELLENGIMVDCHLAHIDAEEQLQYLHVPPTSASHFEKTSEVVSPDGYRCFKCLFVNRFVEEREEEADCVLLVEDKSEQMIAEGKRAVKENKSLMLLREQDQFWVYFLDRDSRDLRRECILDEALIERLKAVGESLGDRKTPYQLTGHKLIQDIGAFVGSKNGLAKEPFHAINRIYALTSLIFKTIQSARETETTVKDHLFPHQFEHRAGRYHSISDQTYTIDGLYEWGLNRLRKSNETLKFNS